MTLQDLQSEDTIRAALHSLFAEEFPDGHCDVTEAPDVATVIRFYTGRLAAVVPLKERPMLNHSEGVVSSGERSMVTRP